MRTIRHFIREALISEDLLAQFGQKGVDKSKEAQLGDALTKMSSSAGKAFDNFSDIARIFGSKAKTGGILSAALAVARSPVSLASLLLAPAGVAAGGYAAYKLYQYLTGDTDVSPENDSEALQQGSNALSKFHDALLFILKSYRKDIIAATKFKDLESATTSSDKDVLLTSTAAHYDKHVTDLCNANDYNTFFTNVKAYKIVQSRIDNQINAEIAAAAPGNADGMKKTLQEWAYMVMVVDYVSNVFRVSADEDALKLEQLGITEDQKQILSQSYLGNKTKIQTESDYDKSKRAIIEMYSG